MGSAGAFGCQPELTRCDTLQHLIPITEKNSPDGCQQCKAEAEEAA